MRQFLNYQKIGAFFGARFCGEMQGNAPKWCAMITKTIIAPPNFKVLTGLQNDAPKSCAKTFF